MSEKRTIEVTSEEDQREEGTAVSAQASAEEDEITPEEEDASGDTEQAEQGDVAQKLEAAEKEIAETYDRFLRVSAEFENYKKRHDREMTEFRKFANQSLMLDLLPIVDNLERAIDSTENGDVEGKSILEGIDLTFKELLKIFEKFNVQPIEAVGQPFDPNFHQAVSREETDEHPENTVTSELQKGYLLHDRLIRPSMVIVAMPKVKSSDTEGEDSPDPSENKTNE